MAPEASLVVFVAGLAGNALETLDHALELTLGSRDGVLVLPVEHLPRDVDAFESARQRGATSVVELVTDERLDRCEVRVCPVDEPCSARRVQFTDGDARDARERAISIVAVAMLPERTRSAAAATTQPSVEAPLRAPPPPPAALETPVVDAPRVQLEGSFSTAIGAPSTFGAEAGARVRALRSFWLRVGTGVRAGSVDGIASSLDVPLSLGLAVSVALTSRLDVGARADAVLQRRSISVADHAGRSRWLFAFRAGPELRARVSRTFGIRGFVGLEANAGTTTVIVGGERTSLSALRAYAEVGPYLTF